MPVGQNGLDIDTDWFNRLKPFSSVASLSPRQVTSTGKWHAGSLWGSFSWPIQLWL